VAENLDFQPSNRVSSAHAGRRLSGFSRGVRRGTFPNAGARIVALARYAVFETSPVSHGARLNCSRECAPVNGPESGRAAAALAVLLVVAGCGSGGRSYEVPTSVMEPTIHCGRPKPGCEGRRNARVRVRAYGEDRPERGDIVALEAPPRAEEHCGFGGVYFKRVIALPGQTWEEKAGVIYVNGRQLAEPYLAASHHRRLLRPRRQPRPLLRLPRVGAGAPGEHPRQGRQDQPVMPTLDYRGELEVAPSLCAPSRRASLRSTGAAE
jgi:signal peptidase I